MLCPNLLGIFANDKVKEAFANDFLATITKCVEPGLADVEKVALGIHRMQHGRGLLVELSKAFFAVFEPMNHTA